MVATGEDSKITISMEDLRTIIQNQVKEETKTIDITSSIHLNEEYVSERGRVSMAKTGNIVTLKAYLNVLKDIPALTKIITIDEQYSPVANFVSHAKLSGVSELVCNVEMDTKGVIKAQTVKSNSRATVIVVDLTWHIKKRDYCKK